MTTDDLPDVMHIERVVFPSPWDEEAFQSEMVRPYSNQIIAECPAAGSPLSGYATYWIMFEEAHILNVAVHPDARRQGIGAALVEHILAHARTKHVTRIFLEVRTTNIAAVQLYKRYGFAVLHECRHFYSDGGDAYKMALFLEAPDALR